MTNRTYVNLDGENGEAVIVVIAHITAIKPYSTTKSNIHLTGGDYVTVEGTVSEAANKVWPQNKIRARKPSRL